MAITRYLGDGVERVLVPMPHATQAMLYSSRSRPDLARVVVFDTCCLAPAASA